MNLNKKNDLISKLELSNKNLNLELHKVRKELEFYKEMCMM